MRTTWKSKVLGAAVASLLLVPLLATAESIEDQLNQMQDRMGHLEDQLRATNDQLTDANSRVDEQAGVIERAGLADENSGLSALSSFLSDTDFYGWVNASYNLNTHVKHDGTTNQNSGSDQAVDGVGAHLLGAPTNPLVSRPDSNHPDNMTFRVNQVWFGMDNAATADSRGGFHVDLLFGADATAGHLDGFGCTGGSSGTDSLCVFTAYASYLAPIGPNGVEIQAGKLPTMLGAEVVQSPWNFNISRGLVWGLQPVTNMGLVTSADVGGGFGIALGVIDNPLGLEDPDNNRAKSLTGQVSWSNDNYGAALSGNWGEQGDAGGSAGAIIDVVLSADPTDALSLWFNFDWVYNEDSDLATTGQTNDNVFGFALAGRYAISDKTGLALRGEYVFNEDDGSTVSAINEGVAGGPVAGSIEQWSVTATADHHLTDNLMIRGEFRYDGATVKGGSNNVFCGSGSGCAYPAAHEDQFLFIVDMTYEF